LKTSIEKKNPMRKTCFFVLALELLSFSTTAQVVSDNPVRIPVNNPTALADWSELLEFKGFLPLSTDVTHQVLYVDNLLFVEDKIIALDVDTEFSAVRVFDGKTGKYLYDIGKYVQSDDPEQGIYGIMDIAWNPDRKYLRVLSSGQNCFSDYTLDGTYLGSVKTGMFGEGLVYLGDDKWLFYNEHNSSDQAGNNYLLFFNGIGELTSRDFPYAETRNGFGYVHTGYLMRSGNDVWFSPPLSDTVYSVVGDAVQPQFELNLGPGAVPVARRDSHIVGNEILKYDILDEGFFSNGRYCVFPLKKGRTMPVGIFDTATERFYDSGNLDKSVPLNNLFRITRLFVKDDKTFVIVKPVQHLKLAVKNADRTAWEALAPGLYDLVIATPEDIDNPILFYFKFK